MKKLMAVFLALVFALGLIGCDQRDDKKLSLDKVVELSAKGEKLTWSDFEQYESIVTGSGLYILVYDIDDIFELTIGGNPNDAPMYITLGTKANRDNDIDIRTDDVQAFIDANTK